MKINNLQLKCLPLYILIASYSHAGVFGGRTLVSTLSIGPAFSNSGQSQTFFLAPEIEKSYVHSSHTNTSASGELFLGMQSGRPDSWSGHFGFVLGGNTSVPVTGEIWDDASPEFNNYTYRYSIISGRAAVKAKLISKPLRFITPWLSATAGISLNRAHSFVNTPTIYEAIPSSNFVNNTQSSFTYSVGAGVQKAITERVNVGVGYEFTDWGKSQLGIAPGQTLNSGLVLDHLYTHAVMFNLTYLV